MVRNTESEDLELKDLKVFCKVSQILELQFVNSYMITIYGRRKLPLFLHAV